MAVIRMHTKFWWASRHFPAHRSEGREQCFCILDSSCSNPRQIGLHGSHCFCLAASPGEEVSDLLQPLETSSDTDTTLTDVLPLLGTKSVSTHPQKLLRACILPSPPPHATKDKKLEPQISVASLEPACTSSEAGGPGLEKASHASAALGWASVFVTASSGGANKTLLLFPSWGCFRGMLLPTPQCQGQPRKSAIPVKFSRSIDRDFYFCWIQQISVFIVQSKGKSI